VQGIQVPSEDLSDAE